MKVSTKAKLTYSILIILALSLIVLFCSDAYHYYQIYQPKYLQQKQYTGVMDYSTIHTEKYKSTLRINYQNITFYRYDNSYQKNCVVFEKPNIMKFQAYTYSIVNNKQFDCIANSDYQNILTTNYQQIRGILIASITITIIASIGGITLIWLYVASWGCEKHNYNKIQMEGQPSDVIDSLDARGE